MPVRSWLRLGGYAAGLVLVLVAGFEIGRHTLSRQPGAAHADSASSAVFGGVTVSASGYTLSADETTAPAGQATTLRLHVSGPDQHPVLHYGVVADRLMRLVRRDLSGYRTLTPSLSADGTWTAPAILPDGGSWRLLADFTALDDAGRATRLLLGLDLSASGTTPQAMTAPASDSTVDGYTITLAGMPRAGKAEPLLVNVRRDGQPVDLDPAARLTVLREGDLAYASRTAGPDTGHGLLRFWVNAPSPGRYRLSWTSPPTAPRTPLPSPLATS